MVQSKLGGPEWLRGKGGACPRTAWFSLDGCVLWSADGEHAQVMVGHTLIGVFGRRELGARNVVLMGLCRGTKVHYGKLAKAFRIGEEQLRKIRLRFEEGGIEAFFDSRRRGRERVLQGKALRDVRRWLGKGVSQRAIRDKLAARGVRVGVGTICNEHKRWVAELSASSPATAEVPGDELPEPPPVASADEELGETSEAAPIALEQDEAATLPTPTCVPAAEEKRGARVAIAPAPPQSGRFVQHVGVWLLTAWLAASGLFESVEHERAQSEREHGRPRGHSVRVALEALLAALALGQRCVEGVRRLQTATAGLLLRATHAPTASWVRRVLGRLAMEGGAARIGLDRAGGNVRSAHSEGPDQATVFYVDNHMRPYHGKHTTRRGWRMQDKRVRPGNCDGWVHDEDGRRLLRINLPAHDSLTSVLSRVAELLRRALGPAAPILLAFDRAGAFPEQLSALRRDGFEFVTYERRPYSRLAEKAFTNTLTLDGEALRWCEPRQRNLGRGRGRVRRIAVRDPDGRQINLLAISGAPAERLIAIQRGRWVQENAFRHDGPRWGQNQLDSRTVVPYAPTTTIPNPARRRLDHSMRVARLREGDARRKLARLRPGDARQDRLRRDLDEALAVQAELEKLRPTVPEHAELGDTDLAGKLVFHEPSYKLLLDTVRAACANAEADLAAVLAPHMRLPAEAKRLLANVFASPGDVRVCPDAITVTLACAANSTEQAAVAALLAEITPARLTLPGDPRRRPLVFRT